MEHFRLIVEIASGLVILGGFLVAVCKPLRNWFKNRFVTPDQRQDDRIAAMEERQRLHDAADLALLHDKLYYLCNKHINDGSITIDDLENLDYLYRAYRDLGGNGVCENLYNRCRDLI